MDCKNKVFIQYASCPFCGGKSFFIEEINVGSLIFLYRRFISVDISYLFNGIKHINYLQCGKCGLQHIDPIVTGDDKFYGALESESYYPQDKIEFSFSKKAIGKQDKVLDIGCGAGMFGKALQCAYYQGIDFSAKAIDTAKSNGINVQAIPIQEHSITHKEFYDCVVCFQFIEHLGANINEFLSSAINCVKKGGHLIIAVPNNDGPIKNITNFCFNLPPHHALYWNEKSLRFLGWKYSLEIETIYIEPANRYWWNGIMASVLVHKLLIREIHKVDLLFTKRIIRFGVCRVSAIMNRMGIGLYKKKTGHTIIVVYKKPIIE